MTKSMKNAAAALAALGPFSYDYRAEQAYSAAGAVDVPRRTFEKLDAAGVVKFNHETNRWSA